MVKKIFEEKRKKSLVGTFKNYNFPLERSKATFAVTTYSEQNKKATGFILSANKQK